MEFIQKYVVGTKLACPKLRKSRKFPLVIKSRGYENPCTFTILASPFFWVIENLAKSTEKGGYGYGLKMACGHLRGLW